MLNNVKQTIKQTTIYGLGNAGSKLIGIILLPLYTNHITVREYGILGILEVTIMILSQTLVLGQPHALLRFHHSEEFKEKRNTTLFTVFCFLLFVGLLVNSIGQPLAPKFASKFFEPGLFTIYFRLCLVIIFMRLMGHLFMHVLRAEERTILYAVSNIIKIAAVLGLNIYFVAFAKLGIEGILYSYAIGDSLYFLMLLPKMIARMRLNFDVKILSASLSFGIPLLFASFASMLLNLGDRYLLKILANYRELGLYDLGYKIAGVLNVFIVQPFTLGFLPLAYKMFGKKGDKRYYSKMQTYLVIVLLWMCLALMIFSKEIVETFALNKEYWLAQNVVPIIAFSYVLAGARSVVNLGMFLQNRTKDLAISTTIGLALNIGLNIILIPKFGMMGAAYATLISHLFLYLISYYLSQKVYPIPYENLKLFKVLIVVGLLFCISFLLGPLNILLRSLVKISLLILFPFIIYAFNFYEAAELAYIKAYVRKLTKRG